ncbi:MAG: 1-deoxy-D-xylulose-5-phosphate reductoisomerase [Lachnospiraceae bacterium]|nr:1-deoxy-D-xylulose-5-phosphate reductoisomerase [Lachnospiraceae bacterium]
MKRLGIFGSTGSIGTQTLEIVRNYPEDLSVSVLVAGTNVTLIERQIREFRPKLVCLFDEKAFADLKERISDLSGITLYTGMEGLLACAESGCYDLMVAAMVGMIGILPTVHAIRSGKDIALANKETLVTAGQFIMPMAEEYHVNIYPVDSEHSAIFQSLQGLFYDGPVSRGHNQIRRILLTASGGPFRGKTLSEMENFTVEDALRHPNWSMGQKVTIDSATMVNKGLEMMEAKWLFGLKPEQIRVVIHPESILHSAVEFIDGAVVGQMGIPDMKLPIQYALFYPERKPMDTKPLDLFEVGALHFSEPDRVNFPALALAEQAMVTGGTMPTVFNAANEYAVSEFLKKRIGFTRVAEMISASMKQHKLIEKPALETIFDTERETYEFLRTQYGRNNG